MVLCVYQHYRLWNTCIQFVKYSQNKNSKNIFYYRGTGRPVAVACFRVFYVFFILWREGVFYTQTALTNFKFFIELYKKLSVTLFSKYHTIYYNERPNLLPSVLIIICKHNINTSLVTTHSSIIQYSNTT